ncbi:hypothetical protein FA95DRAFT_1559071 [Auriscalpium vulgare]|uniref:Uncharacterized protein n=1 Tax=Auriscalpium vulgare TaxID=40419 RepID=A0ACB8RUN0_9AGAM|nr:hypothetical protein FA95DRAFT_1559071 [Auriscalpium vulgare]
MIADAQIAAPHANAHTWTQFFRDVYTRKSWAAARRLRPTDVVFLGDMLSSGVSIESDDEYALYAGKFKGLFPLDPTVRVHYIPGNADVGLGIATQFANPIRQRYERHFGAVNQHASLANHTLVLLDAPGIVDEDYLRAGQGVSFEDWTPVQGGTVEFVKGLAADGQTEPVVLFSHIPLHRAESKQCGPLRERGTIHRGVGRGWQKTLGKHTSAFILENLRPTIIFSADDKDYCDITHVLPHTSLDPSRAIHEVTIKSFSRVRHIQQPGLHLLSLLPAPPASSPDHASNLLSSDRHAHAQCLFPSAYGPATRLYLPGACLTLFIILIAHQQRLRRREQIRLETASPLPTPRSSQLNLSGLGPAHDEPPSPYSASSAYSYSYAYANTPPSQHGKAYFDLPARNDQNQRAPSGSMQGAGGLRTPGTPWTPWTPQSGGAHTRPDHDDEDGDDADHPGEQYLYVPRAGSPAQHMLDRRHAPHLRSLSTTSPPPFLPALNSAPTYEWSYAFTFRGRRRRFALRAPRWVAKRLRAVRESRQRRAFGGEGMWEGAGRDVGRVVGPAAVVWVGFAWWFSR